MAAYATLSDLYLVMPLAVMGTVSAGTQQSILDSRNDFADDKLRARYKLPLQTPYPASLKQHICHLAAWDIMRTRGFNPAAGADPVIQSQAEYAFRWFDDVERQRAHPNVVEAVGGGDPGYPAPQVISKTIQGWYPGTGGGSR